MTARPEDDLNRSHLLGVAPPRSWTPGQQSPTRTVPTDHRRAARPTRRIVPAVPPPRPRPLSPRRAALQYVLIGWVLGVLSLFGLLIAGVAATGGFHR